MATEKEVIKKIVRVWFKEKVARIGDANTTCSYQDNGSEDGNLVITWASGGIERTHKLRPGIIRFTPLSNIADIEYTIK